MFTNKNFWLIVLAAFAAGFGAFFGARYFQTSDPSQAKPALQNAKLYPFPRALLAFELTDSKGQPFGPAQFKSHWSLVFFGFTHCPDICPTTLQEFKQLESLAGFKSLSVLPKFVFVSVDPERDTYAALDQYIRFFSPRFIAATGVDAQLEKLTKSLGVLYTRNQTEGENYSVDHSGGVYLINPEGQLRALFPAPHDAQIMLADLKIIMELN